MRHALMKKAIKLKCVCKKATDLQMTAVFFRNHHKRQIEKKKDFLQKHNSELRLTNISRNCMFGGCCGAKIGKILWALEARRRKSNPHNM